MIVDHFLRRNCLLKHGVTGKIEGRIEVTEDVEEDGNNYRMALRKGENTVN